MNYQQYPIGRDDNNAEVFRFSNFNPLALVTGAAGGLIPEGACFGNKSCQENRAATTANQATMAQAQLLQAQANALKVQADATGSKNMIVIAAIGGVVLLVGVIVVVVMMTKKKSSV